MLSSPGWTRTNNPPVNSRMLCQLSYRGTVLSGRIVAAPARCFRSRDAGRPSASREGGVRAHGLLRTDSHKVTTGLQPACGDLPRGGRDRFGHAPLLVEPAFDQGGHLGSACDRALAPDPDRDQPAHPLARGRDRSNSGEVGRCRADLCELLLEFLGALEVGVLEFA